MQYKKCKRAAALPGHRRAVLVSRKNVPGDRGSGHRHRGRYGDHRILEG